MKGNIYMRTIMMILTAFLLSPMVLAAEGVSDEATGGTLIKYPGFENGEKILFTPNHTTSGSGRYYCNLIMYCNFNVSGCYVANAKDLISAESDANGVCKALGHSKVISYKTGIETAPFSEFRTYDANGKMIDISDRKRDPVYSKRWQCGKYDPSNRSYLYKGKSEVYTSILCE